MKKILITMLRAQALVVLRRSRPLTIAITGSYGKTSTKDAIVATLQELLPKDSVRFPKKSFNNEFGVPLTILGFDSPGKSILGWCGVLIKGLFASVPSVLVLEIGADHKGEIRDWARAIKPDIAVITGISPVHVANYASYEELQQEKASLAQFTTKIILLNGDDELIRKFPNFDASKKYIGKSQADYQIKNEELLLRSDHSYDVGEVMTQVQGEVCGAQGDVSFVLKNAMGYASLMAATMAFATITEMQKLAVYPFAKSDAQDIAKAISKTWKPTVGRMNPLPGIKGTLLLDDSYNAAPAAVEYGLHVLATFPNRGRKIVAIGTMAELADKSESLHQHIGELVAQYTDILVAVGEEMLHAVEGAKQKGMTTDRIHWFANSKDAGRFLDQFVQTGDIIYIKGSQSARMEFVTKDLLAEPRYASQVLVRQEEKWLL